MKIQLNEQLLREVGLKALTPEAGNEVLQVVYEAMEFAVGSRVVQLMSQAQQDRMMAAIEADEHDRSMELLTAAVPDHPQIVMAEAAIAKRWLARHARSILAVCWQPPPPTQGG